MAVCRYHRQPGYHVGMAVQVFSGGVHHDIKTQLQRTVNDRGGEGVIRHAYHVMAAGNGPDGCQVGQFQQRVSRRLHPDHARLGTNGGFQRGQIVGLYPADPQPGAALAHVFNQTVGAAIHVINGDDMAVFIQQLQYGGNGGQTGSKSIAARAAFQFGDGGFQRMAGRIAATGIFVAGMLPRRRLRKRRGGVNGRHDRAVLIVNLAAVYAERGEIFHSCFLIAVDGCARR